MDATDPLVSTDWLARHLDDEDLRVVDIRGYVKKTDLGGGRQRADYVAAPEEYAEGHVPGAVYVDWTADITDPDDPVPVQVAPPDVFATRMSVLGIGDGTRVVVYDHAGGQFAARLWWALGLYGHDRASVLEGGWRKWKSEGRPTTANVPAPPAAMFSPKRGMDRRVDAAEVLRASRDEETFVLDARDEAQYTGEVRRGDGRPGHIPGAAHLHSDALFDPETGEFRSEREIEALLREVGAPEDRDAPVVTYCNGGVAATVPILAMRRLGYTNLALYDGSWNEWGSREDLPNEA